MNAKRLLVAIGILLLVIPSKPVVARVRLQDICQVHGEREMIITGLGLVYGLNGTGDGGDSVPAMRALAAAMQHLDSPVQSVIDLQDANNIAIVMVEATIPRGGLLTGQKVDCHVSSFLGAKSLYGGRLLVAPLSPARIGNNELIGIASGGVRLEDPTVLTTGRIPGGVVVQQDVPSQFNARQQPTLRLLLNPSHASFTSASEIARVINQEFSFESGTQQMAKALGPGVVEVRIPPQYQNSQVDFIAQLMEVGIENPQTQAKVIVNPKTQTVIVTGEVEISPVIISHKNLSIDITGVPVGGGASFVSVPDVTRLPADASLGGQSTVHLKQLVEALNQMRVPTGDVIEIIRELHHSGKLHAIYEEH